MSSIHSSVRRMGRWWRGVLGAAGLAMLVVSMGCQPLGKGVVAPLNPDPIALDEAMLVRDWPLTTADYPNGAVQAWPTGFWVEASEDLPWFGALVVEPALFVGQTLLLPVSYALVPPWTPVVYHGVEIPPTYTAAPLPIVEPVFPTPPVPPAVPPAAIPPAPAVEPAVPPVEVVPPPVAPVPPVEPAPEVAPVPPVEPAAPAEPAPPIAPAPPVAPPPDVVEPAIPPAPATEPVPPGPSAQAAPHPAHDAAPGARS